MRIYKYKFIYSVTEKKIIRFGGVDLNRLDLCVFPLDLIMEIKVELIWGRDAWKKE